MLAELDKIDEALGFYNIKSHPQLLQALAPFDFAVLFIGLIFDILLIIFVVISILLVYSLLLISVETKTFEFGVMRLVGLTKMGFVAMIITQSAMFVFPAVILAFILAFPIIYGLYSSLFSDSLGYIPSVIPSWSAFLWAIFIGVLIPFLSAIVPIKRALSTNLTEALNVSRSKSTGVLITFINNKEKDVGSYLLFGSIAVLFGISIYYGLPVALLELNFGLILTIFFMILLGLLLGLVLIAVNLQSALEKLLLYLLLFWESKAMKTVLAKNMGAHKNKNKLTAIIYALTLGCIIFLLTSANLQIATITAISKMTEADIIVEGHYYYIDHDTGIDRTLQISTIDAVIANYSSQISDWGYKSEKLNRVNYKTNAVRIDD